MKILFLSVYAACIFVFSSSRVEAQKQSTSKQNGLFETDETLHIRLSGTIRELTNDKDEDAKFHPLILSYKNENGGEDSLQIEAKTRGHFRRTMGDCLYPPLLLQFSQSDTLASSLFNGQDKLKLVMPCKGDDYVIREWIVYRIYNMVTPKSFRVRLVSVELNDTKRKKIAPAFYGFLLESDKQMAARNNDVLIKPLIRPEQTDTAEFLKMAVFEYLIGNTDWSVQYQNIKIIAPDSASVPIAVPYDFDFSGVVNAPYAQPAQELQMSSVRERRYRGYCIADMKKFDDVVNYYNHLRATIYKLYTDCPLLDIKYVKATISYFDEFYQAINNPAALQKEFGYPCDKNGTGNVVIKGLKPD